MLARGGKSSSFTYILLLGFVCFMLVRMLAFQLVPCFLVAIDKNRDAQKDGVLQIFAIIKGHSQAPECGHHGWLWNCLKVPIREMRLPSHSSAVAYEWMPVASGKIQVRKSPVLAAFGSVR